MLQLQIKRYKITGAYSLSYSIFYTFKNKCIMSTDLVYTSFLDVILKKYIYLNSVNKKIISLKIQNVLFRNDNFFKNYVG